MISVLSNVAPRQTHDICARFFAGDMAGSCAEQLRAIPLCSALFCEVNPIPVKTALSLLGWRVGALRSPMCPPVPENLERIKTALSQYGLVV